MLKGFVLRGKARAVNLMPAVSWMCQLFLNCSLSSCTSPTALLLPLQGLLLCSEEAQDEVNAKVGMCLFRGLCVLICVPELLRYCTEQLSVFFKNKIPWEP